MKNRGSYRFGMRLTAVLLTILMVLSLSGAALQSGSSDTADPGMGEQSAGVENELLSEDTAAPVPAPEETAVPSAVPEETAAPSTVPETAEPSPEESDEGEISGGGTPVPETADPAPTGEGTPEPVQPAPEPSAEPTEVPVPPAATEPSLNWLQEEALGAEERAVPSGGQRSFSVRIDKAEGRYTLTITNTGIAVSNLEIQFESAGTYRNKEGLASNCQGTVVSASSETAVLRVSKQGDHKVAVTQFPSESVVAIVLITEPAVEQGSVCFGVKLRQFLDHENTSLVITDDRSASLDVDMDRKTAPDGKIPEGLDIVQGTSEPAVPSPSVSPGPEPGDEYGAYNIVYHLNLPGKAIEGNGERGVDYVIDRSDSQTIFLKTIGVSSDSGTALVHQNKDIQGSIYQKTYYFAGWNKAETDGFTRYDAIDYPVTLVVGADRYMAPNVSLTVAQTEQSKVPQEETTAGEKYKTDLYAVWAPQANAGLFGYSMSIPGASLGEFKDGKLTVDGQTLGNNGLSSGGAQKYTVLDQGWSSNQGAGMSVITQKPADVDPYKFIAWFNKSPADVSAGTQKPERGSFLLGPGAQVPFGGAEGRVYTLDALWGTLSKAVPEQAYPYDGQGHHLPFQALDGSGMLDYPSVLLQAAPGNYQENPDYGAPYVIEQIIHDGVISYTAQEKGTEKAQPSTTAIDFTAPGIYHYTAEGSLQVPAGYIAAGGNIESAISFTKTEGDLLIYPQLTLHITKDLAGGEQVGAPTEFEFLVTGDEGVIDAEKNIMSTQTVTVGAGETGVFSLWLSKPGSHTITITEKDTQKPGVVYDSKMVTVAVEVDDNYHITSVTVDGEAGTVDENHNGTASMTFTNTYNTGTLTVEKRVTGYAEPNDSFPIEVTLSQRAVTLPEGARELSASGTGSGCRYVIALKNGESAVFGVPEHTEYTVSEPNAGDYYETVSITQEDGTEGGTGTVTQENSAQVTVTNTRKTGSLHVKKIVEGGLATDNQTFSFTVTLGKAGFTGTIDGVSFLDGVSAPISVEAGETGVVLEELPAGVTYEINEGELSEEFAAPEYENRTGTIQEDTVAEVTITNRYQPGSLAVSKTAADGGAGERFLIHVTLTGPNGQPVEKVATEPEEAARSDGNGQFTIDLADGETVVFEDLARGTRYVVREAPHDRYAATYEKGGQPVSAEQAEGTIGDENGDSVLVVNTPAAGLTYHLAAPGAEDVKGIDTAWTQSGGTYAYPVRQLAEVFLDLSAIKSSGVNVESNDLKKGTITVGGKSYYFAGWSRSENPAGSYEAADYRVSVFQQGSRRDVRLLPGGMTLTTSEKQADLYAVWVPHPGLLGYQMIIPQATLGTHTAVGTDDYAKGILSRIENGTIALGDNGSSSAGGSGTYKYVVLNEGYPSGGTVTVTEDQPQAGNSGYTFVAWYNNKAGTGNDPNREHMIFPGGTLTFGGTSDVYSIHATWAKTSAGDERVFYDGQGHAVGRAEVNIAAHSSLRSAMRQLTDEVAIRYAVKIEKQTEDGVWTIISDDAEQISGATEGTLTDFFSKEPNQNPKTVQIPLPTVRDAGHYKYTIQVTFCDLSDNTSVEIPAAAACLTIDPVVEITAAKAIQNSGNRPGADLQTGWREGESYRLTLSEASNQGQTADVTVTGSERSRSFGTMTLPPGTYSFTLAEQVPEKEPGMRYAPNLPIHVQVDGTTEPYTVTVDGIRQVSANVIRIERTLTNTWETGTLFLQKMITHETCPEEENFQDGPTFRFTISSEPALEGTYGELTFSHGQASVEMTIGKPSDPGSPVGTLKLTGLPAGVIYAVTEEQDPRYAVSVSPVSLALQPDSAETAQDANTVTVTNAHNPGTLTITEHVKDPYLSSRGGAEERIFKFTVSLFDDKNQRVPVGAEYCFTVSNPGEEAQKVPFENGQTEIQLKNDGRAVADSLPETVRSYLAVETVFVLDENGTEKPVDEEYTGQVNGREETVQETQTSGTGYTARGEFAADQSASAAFVNTMKTGTVTISKKVTAPEGVSVSDRVFAVELTLGGEAYREHREQFTKERLLEAAGACARTAEITETMARLTLALRTNEVVAFANLPAGIQYTVKELEANQGGFVTTYEPSAGGDGQVAGVVGVDETKSVVITNTYQPGGLTISKDLPNGGSEERLFTIRVTLSGDGFSAAMNGTYAASYKTVPARDAAGMAVPDTIQFSSASALVQLYGGESVTILGLPDGIGYTVAEDMSQGVGEHYTVTYQGPDAKVSEYRDPVTGTISKNQTQTVAVINTLKTGSLTIEKTETIEGGTAADQSRVFLFQVELEGYETFSGRCAIAETGRSIQFIDGVCTDMELKPGDSVTLLGLPEGANAIVTETGFRTDRGTSALGTMYEETAGQEAVITAAGKASVAFTNARAVGSLTVEKIADRPYSDQTSFSFTVQLMDGETPVTGTYGRLAFDNGIARFTLAPGQRVTFTDLPAGASYIVAETNAVNYDTVYTNAQGTITAAGTAVTVENTRRTGSLTIRKTVTGGEDPNPGRAFAFRVQLADKTVAGTFGDVYFERGAALVTVAGNSEKTIAALPAGMAYTVTEEQTAGYTTPTATFTGKVGDGSIAHFVNTYQSGSLTIHKTVEEGGNPRGVFSFQMALTGENDAGLSDTYPIAATAGSFGSAEGSASVGNGTITFENGLASFALTCSEGQAGVTISGLPQGAKYTVREIPREDYVSTVTGNGTGTIGPETAAVEISNRFRGGSLVVSKRVEGNQSSQAEQFRFQVTLRENGQPYQGYCGVLRPGAARVESLVLDGEPFFFYLRDGESLKLEGLPEGVAYEVEEIENEAGQGNINEYVSYLAADSDAASGVIRDLDERAVQFVNTCLPNTLVVAKRVTNLPAGERTDTAYHFQVKLKSGSSEAQDPGHGTYVQGKETVDDGWKGQLLQFDENGEIKFVLQAGQYQQITNLPDGVEITVEEVAEDDAAYTASYTVYSEEGIFSEDKNSVTGPFTSNVTGAAVVFTNTYQTGSLTVRKDVRGAPAADLDRAFEFELTLTRDDSPFDFDGFGQMVTHTAGTGTYIFSLQNGETVTFDSLPEGTAYTVKERNAKDYVTSMTGTGAVQNGTAFGTVHGEEEIVCTNTYAVGSLMVTKEIPEGGNRHRSFHFTVTKAGESTYGNSMAGSVNETDLAAGKTISFGNGMADFTLAAGQTADFAALPAGDYLVREADYSAEGYTTAYSFGQTAAADGGVTVSVREGESAKVAVTNSFQGSNLTITKAVEGERVPDREFTFQVSVSPAITGPRQTVDGSGQTGTVDFTEGPVRIRLRKGESITIQGLPRGAECTVREISRVPGFTADSARKTVILKEETETVLFTNTYATGVLTVGKMVAGSHADPNESFLFQVELDDDTYNDSYSDGSREVQFIDGRAAFRLKEGESVRLDRLPGGVRYTVYELRANRDGYGTTVTGGDHQWTDDSGAVCAEGTVTAGVPAQVTFVNRREAPAGSLVVTNTVAGNSAEAEKAFSYTVLARTDSEEAAIATDDGTYTFTLTTGQSWVHALPAGTTWIVTQQEESGYVTTVNGSVGLEASVEIADGETREVHYINTRNQTNPSPTGAPETSGSPGPEQSTKPSPGVPTASPPSLSEPNRDSIYAEKWQSVNDGPMTKENIAVHSGDVVRYSITVTNGGKSTAAHLVLRDGIPRGDPALPMVLVSSDPTGVMNRDTLVWQKEELLPGEQWTVTFTCTVPSFAQTTVWKNQAAGSYVYADGENLAVSAAEKSFESNVVTAAGQTPGTTPGDTMPGAAAPDTGDRNRPEMWLALFALTLPGLAFASVRAWRRIRRAEHLHER